MRNPLDSTCHPNIRLGMLCPPSRWKRSDLRTLLYSSITPCPSRSIPIRHIVRISHYHARHPHGADHSLALSSDCFVFDVDPQTPKFGNRPRIAVHAADRTGLVDVIPRVRGLCAKHINGPRYAALFRPTATPPLPPLPGYLPSTSLAHSLCGSPLKWSTSSAAPSSVYPTTVWTPLVDKWRASSRTKVRLPCVPNGRPRSDPTRRTTLTSR